MINNFDKFIRKNIQILRLFLIFRYERTIDTLETASKRMMFDLNIFISYSSNIIKSAIFNNFLHEHLKIKKDVKCYVTDVQG